MVMRGLLASEAMVYGVPGPNSFINMNPLVGHHRPALFYPHSSDMEAQQSSLQAPMLSQWVTQLSVTPRLVSLQSWGSQALGREGVWVLCLVATGGGDGSLPLCLACARGQPRPGPRVLAWLGLRLSAPDSGTVPRVGEE